MNVVVMRIFTGTLVAIEFSYSFNASLIYNFRLLLQCRWDLCSSGIVCSKEWYFCTSVSVQPISPVFKNLLELCNIPEVCMHNPVSYNFQSDPLTLYRTQENCTILLFFYLFINNIHNSM
jgi:hypothetical protein